MTLYNYSVEAINAAEASELDKAKARALMYGYTKRWEESDRELWESIAEESEFHLPIVNPETARRSRKFSYAGKRDGIIRSIENDKPYLREFKTTSQDIADPDAIYWRSLYINSQVRHYKLAGWQQRQKLAGVLYDVIRKPGIRPKKLTKAGASEIIASKEYYGTPVSEEAKQAVYDGEETEELFECRLRREVVENSERYYQRKVISILDDELLEYANELWGIAKDVAGCQNNGRWYMNSGACFNYQRPCEFISLCSGHDMIESDRWVRRDDPHEELDTPLNSSALTNSSIQCFKTCRRKYHYRYELGIENFQRESSDALQFGSLLHDAMEAWWSNLSFVEI